MAPLPWYNSRVNGSGSGLSAISLFSGIGGLDAGVTAAGFDVRVAVEYDRDSAASLRANHFVGAEDRVIERSILAVSTAEILERGGLRAGELSLVVGGPPCTPFSKSGYWLEYKRKGLDPNASLIDEFARVVREARPEVALLENVHGLAYRNHNAIPFARLLAQLRDAGYGVAYRVLSAADYGVPQLRKRLVVYAVRGGTPPPFPTPTHSGWSETRRSVDASLAPYVTSRQAIGDLEDRDDLMEAEEQVGGKYGDLLPLIPPGDNYLFLTAKRGYPDPRFEWRTRYWTFLLKLDPDRPSTTIQSQPGPYIGPFHWRNRRLRLLEAMRLQTFPDDYVVIGNRRSAQVQVGNAVPPLLAEVAARPLAELVLAKDVARLDQRLVRTA
ncbi:MAG: DNA cytosine methyltransferase [Cryobacterium sp.]|nr:DNA cytosine methyltransferase [Cryobacterium sp.]